MKLFSLLNGVHVPGTKLANGHNDGDEPASPPAPEQEGPQLRPTQFYPIINPMDVDKHRRLNCKYYERCLDIAIMQRWDGFHCNECKAFVPISKEKMRKASRGLLAIFDQGRASDGSEDDS